MDKVFSQLREWEEERQDLIIRSQYGGMTADQWKRLVKLNELLGRQT